MTLIPVMPLCFSQVSDCCSCSLIEDAITIGELFYSVSSELTAVTFAEALQTLLSQMMTLPLL